MTNLDTVTITIPASKNKDDLIIACYAAASEARELGHLSTAKSYSQLADFIEENNSYSAEDAELLGVTQ